MTVSTRESDRRLHSVEILMYTPFHGSERWLTSFLRRCMLNRLFSCRKEIDSTRGVKPRFCQRDLYKRPTAVTFFQQTQSEERR